MTVCIVDTGVFLNVLDVPGRNERRDTVLKQLGKRIGERWNLLLPMAAIIETGNHIGHLSDGSQRRRFAELFCTQVVKSIIKIEVRKMGFQFEVNIFLIECLVFLKCLKRIIFQGIQFLL